MPRPPETPDVRASKALAYILRHGAEKEGLAIRSDGFVRLVDVLARPKMKEIDEPTVHRLVEENAKKRFELQWAHDPSPPRPKKRVKTKKEKQQEKALQDQVNAATDGGDADALEELKKQLASMVVTEPEWIELPLVPVPVPISDNVDVDAAAGSSSTPRAEWFIRATQGHSIALESTSHLEPINDDEEGRSRAGLLVHGTRWELWDVLKEQGLSRMARQHVHLAPALSDHRITPRAHSTLLIYLSLPAMLTATPPIPVYTSLNGVVLTPGDVDGLVKKEYWKKAVRLDRGRRVVVWEDGHEVERDELDETEGAGEA